MKALALDTSISKIIIASKNENNTITEILDIGMKQSETLLPSVIDVLEKNSLKTENLDFISVARGPGSFTGLRLGFSCVKALQMATKKPLFSYSTLDLYAEPFLSLPFVVLSAIDAHRERFYFKAFENGKEIIPEGDYENKKILDFLKSLEPKKDFFIAGPYSESLKDMLLENGIPNKIFSSPFSFCTTDFLFEFAEKDLLNGKTGIDDYEGPVYLRASEAEENLKK